MRRLTAAGCLAAGVWSAALAWAQGGPVMIAPHTSGGMSIGLGTGTAPVAETGGSAPSSPAAGVNADAGVPRIRNAPGGLAVEGEQMTQPGVQTGTAAEADTADDRGRRGSEFQRFVAEATGVTLPRFGERFFSGPTTFAPVDRVPVPADYVLGPGDELLIRAWGSVDIDYRAVVDRTGLISLPRVGTVRVAGLKAGEVESFLRQQVGRVFRNFELNVTLGQLRSIQVYVVGQARRPGSYTVSSLSTLINAVLASGGPSATGSMRAIELRRAGRAVAMLDLYQFLLRGDQSADVRLQPGDVIVYHPVGPQVALMGATDNAAIFELRAQGETLRDLIGYAGGLPAITATHQAMLERLERDRPRDPRKVQTLALDEAGLGQVLRDGDVVTLFQVAPQFANAVTLRGNVWEPLRYPYKPGMKISDLIPEKAALLTKDFYRRKNSLVQFIGEAQSAIDPDNKDGARSAQLPTLQSTSASVPPTLSPTLPDEPNWEYAVVERLNPKTLKVELLPFHLGRAVVERDPRENLELLPGDVVTIYGRKDLRAPQATATRLVRVEGEVMRPGIYQLEPGETLRALLKRAGGFTPQAYVYGLEFSRESTRQKQREAIAEAVRRLEATLASEAASQTANLGTTDVNAAARLREAQMVAAKAQLNRLRNLQPNGRIALQLSPTAGSVDDLPEVPLEDGDRVLVPARPGFVFAVGAVANSNALIWRPGRTVGDYLRQAGLEPSADEDNIFVVHADGSVTHRRDGGWLLNRLTSLELAPGDVIVVPELLNRETTWSAFVRGLKDWTQILYQFGLAAAAIDTLRR
ncbi:Polysialic acid transport protein KpsD [Tepidimonas sediminis]|uniref:Polysialic acid transport protein KpsD n=2 Tax=Tepidimonas sediminis TaxID=2588941 RepID=A0A554WHI0_9BURK|nr:Polysialic acid transport protein KpsD [Tepidimonas sediminis]